MTRAEIRKTPTYSSWNNILGRCLNPNGSGYKHYGAKGITICKRWRCYKNFLADMGERPIGTSIERIDNRKGYEPGNCRWATPHEQSRNTKTNVFLSARGETLILQDWARKLKINPCTIKHRIKMLGWDIERAIFTPAMTPSEMGKTNLWGTKRNHSAGVWPPPAHNRYMESLE